MGTPPPTLPGVYPLAPHEEWACTRTAPLATSLVSLLALLACGDVPVCCSPPPGGTLRVTTVTTGANLDPDGYTLVTRPQIAGRDSLTRAIGTNATVNWDLEPASHTVRLKDLQPNCVATGDNPRSITIAKGDTAPTTFAVNCSD